ncbi:MAG: hypothetical protein MUF62_06070 [Chitinophagaceae bacterium]|jgi:hypothetical protein|nr:hypothetical protein [Chitinophagaceae bacterium]
MKTLLLACTLALASLATYAHPTPAAKVVSYRASQNLATLFGKVDDLNWVPARNNMLRANFTLDGEMHSVFFDAEGEFLAATRPIKRGELPLRLRLALEQKFRQASITESFELTTDTDHAWYFCTLSQGKAQVWKAYENGRIEEVDLRF